MKTELVGARRFHATTRAAAESLDHMDEATTAAARLVAQRSRGRAPKRSGRLASSLTPTGTGDTARVASGVVYAGVIHYGWAVRGIEANPFLVPVANDTEPVWLRFDETAVDKRLNIIKGHDVGDIRLSSPRVRVIREGHEPLEVQTANPDMVLWDRTRVKHKWPKFDEAPFLWLTFIAWAGARRTGAITPETRYETWEAEVLDVADTSQDDTTADDDDDVGGPTPPGPVPG